MAKRPIVTAPKFGAWLELQRGTHRSAEQVAIHVRALLKPTGLKVPRSLIDKIEGGRVPSWPLLAALCRVYKVDIRSAVVDLVDAIEFAGSEDLLCPSDGVQRASDSLPATEGATHADTIGRRPTSSSRPHTAPIVRAVDYAADLVELSDHLQRVSDHLRRVTDAIARGQVATIGDPQTEHPRRARKSS